MMRIAFRQTAVLILLAAPAGLAGPAASALASGGTPNPGGVPSSPVTPAPRSAALATWFGPGFYGRRTACGQVLTPAVVGVAKNSVARWERGELGIRESAARLMLLLAAQSRSASSSTRSKTRTPGSRRS